MNSDDSFHRCREVPVSSTVVVSVVHLLVALFSSSIAVSFSQLDSKLLYVCFNQLQITKKAVLFRQLSY